MYGRGSVGIGPTSPAHVMSSMQGVDMSTHRMCLQANTRVDSGNYRENMPNHR